MVSLQGDYYDLQDCVKLYSTPLARVYSTGATYFLTSTRFEKFEFQNEVEDVASELVKQLNIFARMRCLLFTRISVDEVYRKNRSNGLMITMGIEPAIASELRVEQLRTDDENKLSDGLSYKNYAHKTNHWLHKALFDDRVKQALKFFDETPTTWWSLRKVCEVICQSKNIQATKLKKNGWADREETERFKRWAGYYIHAELNRPDGETMKLEDAHEFVNKLLINWLNDEKCNSTGGT